MRELALPDTVLIWEVAIRLHILTCMFVKVSAERCTPDILTRAHTLHRAGGSATRCLDMHRHVLLYVVHGRFAGSQTCRRVGSNERECPRWGNLQWARVAFMLCLHGLLATGQPGVF